MKNQMKQILAVAGMASLLTLSSCETINSLFKKKEKVETVKKEVVLPVDREAVQAKKDPKAYSPEEFASGIIKGDWAIEEVFDQEAIGEFTPFIKFSEADGRIYGNNGCNTVNAEYRYNPADSTLTFSHVAVTMMYCAKEGITDYLVNKALDDTRTYTLADTEAGYELSLFNENGRRVMLLTHQNLDFLNGTWRVVSIEGEPVEIDSMKLVFDVDEHKVHGNTGCNVLNGRFETDLDEPNTFSFEAIAVTMMMCPQMQYQTAMLVALEEASRAKPIDKDRVQLLSGSGEVVMTLERAADK